MTDIKKVNIILSTLSNNRPKEIVKVKRPEGGFFHYEQGRLFASNIIYPFDTDDIKYKFERKDSSPDELVDNPLHFFRSVTLDNVTIKESEVHGKGVFAKKDIKKGQVVTLYPGDIAIYLPDGYEGEKILTISQHSARMRNKIDKENIKIKDAWLGMDDYGYLIDDNHVIVGCPDFINNPSYLGHMINDKFACDFDKITPEMYIKMSLEKTNATQVHIADNMHVAIVAKRDIKAGEEVFIPYGLQFWSIKKKNGLI